MQIFDTLKIWYSKKTKKKKNNLKLSCLLFISLEITVDGNKVDTVFDYSSKCMVTWNVWNCEKFDGLDVFSQTLCKYYASAALSKYD